MSRVQIPDNFTKGGLEVFVGWDNPLETFFGQVYDRSKPEAEQIIYWIGLQVGEIPTVSELDDRMKNFCTIPETIAAELVDAKRDRTEPTPLQRFMREL
jgi:hypothetical protein